MKKIDLLYLLYHKKITEKQAYKLYNKAIDCPDDKYPRKLLSLSKAEWTAQDFGYRTIARWRYEGWPKKCPLCKRKLVIEKYGWMNKKVGNRRKLAHVDCSDDYLRMLGYTAEEMGYGDTKIKPVTKTELKKLHKKFKYVFWDQLEPITEKEIQQLKKITEADKKKKGK